jgi:hypothetical protein
MALHEITAEHVRVFEVWNEPDGLFWTGTLAQYLKLYDDTVAAVERAARVAGVQVAVGGPALTFPDVAWIEPFLAHVVAGGLPLDFLSWHYYLDYPALGPTGGIPAPPPGVPPVWYNPFARAQEYGAQVALVRDEAAKYPTLHPKLWIDEWNLDAGYDARHDGPYDAAMAAAVLDSVQGAALDRMSFFKVTDDPGPTGNWGMLTVGLRPKPVYYAFDFWHRLAGRSLGVAITPDQSASDASGRVGAVASRPGAGNGSVRVLLYDYVPFDATGGNGTHDPTPYDTTARVTVRGLRPGRYGVRASVVDGVHQTPGVRTLGTRSAAGGDGSIAVTLPVPGDSVTLLELDPVRA